MLAAGAGMFHQDIGDGSLAADQPTRTGVEQHGLDDVLAFEDVQAPLLRGRRLAGVGRLVVFQNDFCAGDSVGFTGQQAGGVVVRFLLLYRSVEGVPIVVGTPVGAEGRLLRREGPA